MLHLKVISHRLHFRFDAGTSRGVMRTRDGIFLIVGDAEKPGITGIGECGPLPGLSIDSLAAVETRLRYIVALRADEWPAGPGEVEEWLSKTIGEDMPSLRFGLEVALKDVFNGGRRLIYDNSFFTGERSLQINGLVWMGDRRFMRAQVDQKLSAGHRCIKLKVGALDIDEELEILAYIRQNHAADRMQLRLDANGAFSPSNALEIIERFAAFDIHSIEQPIRPGQPEAMADLCRLSPVPIALDEELIGVHDTAQRRLLQRIRPQYLVLKPTLLGGLDAVARWIELAEAHDVRWWVTSALESNIGLNAIAQFVAQYDNTMAQGLGTGQLYTNNIPSPLIINGEYLHYDPAGSWDLSQLLG